MQKENTIIPGLKLIYLERHSDDRGLFRKVFSEELFNSNELVSNYKECYFSISHKNVIRGMHFQVPPYEHFKLVIVNQGKILDVVLDIRNESETFGKFFQIEISDSSDVVLYIPVGCAHGFLSLEDQTIVSYIQSSIYNIQCDQGIKWNSFGMNWPVFDPIISERDKNFPEFTNIKSPF